MKQHKVILVRRLPMAQSYYAICLFGFIFARRPLSAVELNHERIHAVQQRELLYVPFLLWYVAEWLVLLVRYRNATKAYCNIRFEREAYRHEHDLHYLVKRKHYSW
jgi:hypothetical protein